MKAKSLNTCVNRAVFLLIWHEIGPQEKNFENLTKVACLIMLSDKAHA